MKRIISLLISCLFIICCFQTVVADSDKASIGLSKYNSLQEAIDNASDGDTVTLLDNCDQARVVSKTITIDLNGHTITGLPGDYGDYSSTIYVDEDSNLTIKGQGRIVSNGDYIPIDDLFDSCIENAGELSLIDVELETESAICIFNFGDVTIKRSKLLSGIGLWIDNTYGNSIEIISGQFSDDENDCVYDNVDSNSTYYDDGISPYPYYVKEKHFVTYHVDGVPSKDSNPYYVGETYAIDKEDPTKEGYKFDGWNTEDDGSGSKYIKGENILFEDADINLYVLWVKEDNKTDEKNVIVGHKTVPNTYTR